MPVDRREIQTRNTGRENQKSPGKDFSRNYRPKNWISNRPVNMAPIVAINPGIMNE